MKVCSGCREKRLVCGASAASGVPPLTCPTHGPTGSIGGDARDLAIGHAEQHDIRVVAQRNAPRSQPRTHSAADAAACTDDVDALDHPGSSSLADTGLAPSVTKWSAVYFLRVRCEVGARLPFQSWPR